VLSACSERDLTTRYSVDYYLRINASSVGSGPVLEEDQVSLVVEVFRMLADATRIQVLWALVDGELSVTELAGRVGKPAPSVSQHLAKLRMARLVRTRREATTIFYSLENEHVRQLVVDAVFNAEHAGPGVPSHHREDPTVRGITTERPPRRQAGQR
jgi:ArsR family transcriptional regulator, zinc-responsive transcriptional repressor